MPAFWSRIERGLGAIADELRPDKHREVLTTAQTRLEEGDYAAAAKLAQSVLDEVPHHASAWTILGLARDRAGEPQGALEALLKARAHGGHLSQLCLELGSVYLRLRRWPEAADEFRQVRNLAKGDRELLAQGYRGLGIAMVGLGQFDRAVRELRKAVAEDPDDLLALSALGDAITRAGDHSHEQARQHLRRAAERKDCPVSALITLGHIELKQGDLNSAELLFRRALEENDKNAGELQPDTRARAHSGLAQIAIARDQWKEAARLAEIAGDLDKDDGDIQLLLAQIATHQGEPLAGYYHARKASERNIAGATEAMLRCAIASRDRNTLLDAHEAAKRVLAHSPNEPLAVIVNALNQYSENPQEACRLLLDLATHRGDASAFLLLATLELDAGDLERADAHFLEAMRHGSDMSLARVGLQEARERRYGLADLDGSAGEPDPHLPPRVLAQRFFQLCSNETFLVDVRGDVAAAIEELDQPLLVTVMGEFSSGKSTFVNAFVGSQVVPTGITPTTATINVIRYGREPSGRVFFRNGTLTEYSDSEIRGLLENMDSHTAGSIGHVELLVPLAALQKVHLVDTPGLNSIRPEHEAVARDFIEKADAVVWIFSASQAGKSSEKAALQALNRAGVRVLGVVNKADQVSPAQLSEVVSHLALELQDVLEVVVPVSSREQGKRGEGESFHELWSRLQRELEQRFFAQATQIKNRLGARNLAVIARDAERHVRQEKDRATNLLAELLQVMDATQSTRRHLLEAIVFRERTQLNDDISRLYRETAEEVLDLVQPRTTVFSGHRTSRADRDYLVGVLDSGYASLLKQSEQRVLAELRTTGYQLVDRCHVVEGFSRALDAALQWLQVDVYQRTQAYVAGYLRGGYLERFFREELARLDLVPDNIYHALRRDSPGIDDQLSLGLERGVAKLFDDLCGKLEHQIRLAEIKKIDLDTGVLPVLEAFANRFALAAA